jgi:hypothetical protein
MCDIEEEEDLECVAPDHLNTKDPELRDVEVVEKDDLAGVGHFCILFLSPLLLFLELSRYSHFSFPYYFSHFQLILKSFRTSDSESKS